MKNAVLLGLFTLLFSATGKAQSSEVKAVKNTIIAFAAAGDRSDADKLSNYLDDHYRIVMNRLFGSKGVSIVSKSMYLEKIKAKEWGGDTRKLNIENVVVNGTTASAKVTFNGKKSSFISLITLVKNEQGQWKLIEEVPLFT